MKIRTFFGIGVALFFLVFTYSALAAPAGPGIITPGANFRRTTAIDNSTTGTIVQAQAGNVTSLFINSTSLTKRWQGYYGNITGSITLDDANNKSLYDWQIASPLGEIYASNGTASGTVNWASVFCFNYTNNMSEGQTIVQAFNGTAAENFINANAEDMDSINNTFNSTFTGTVRVGDITINQDSSCRRVTLFQSDAHQTSNFEEILLTDNQSLIFASILEQDLTGFQGANVDFQMIVGENGDSTAATPYYFFVELS